MSKPSIEEITSTIMSVVRLLQERSDTGYVIGGAAALEAGLEAILVARMRTMTKTFHKKLFRNYGPLSTFAGKTDLLYAFGFISKEVYDDIRVIIKVRNIFAHSPILKTLKDSDVLKELVKFSTYEQDKSDDMRETYMSLLKRVPIEMKNSSISSKS